MNVNCKIVTQECHFCGKRFDLMYWANGTYTYLEEPCECEAEFSPVDGKPTLMEWLEQIKNGGTR